MKKLLVIDADEVVYKVGFGSQRTDYFIKLGGNTQGPFQNKKAALEWLGDGEADEIYSEVTPSSPHNMESNLRRVVNQIVYDNKPIETRLYLTGKDNFRIEEATLLPYKGNRKDNAKPIYYHEILRALKEEYGAIIVDGMEADDALSITSWSHQKKENPTWEVVIATQDKDLNMVPGLHYNPSSREIYTKTSDEAKYCFYHQLLTGDSTDNIPGVPGIGKIKASKILDPLLTASEAELYQAVLEQYQRAENTENLRAKLVGDKLGHERIEEVARLLWMQQERNQMWNREERYYI